MQRVLRNVGFVLLLLGVSSFLWPMIQEGRRSKIMAVFGELERIAASASLAVGAVLFGLSFRKKKEGEKK
jgi:hypothetical protein